MILRPEKLFIFFLFFVCVALGRPDCPVFADNWQASIYEDSAPGKLVGVDKKHRLFNFFERKSPLRLRYSYPCVTGQLQGDKQQTNDKRTPEGVYFVEYKIASGLDFREYGGIAYTLNYPNPVDRLRGKTGHGIWIHSKGFELVPTRGCVAIDLQNINEIGPLLAPGTPVVVAEELKSISGADDGALAELRDLMRDWSRAWEGRSAKLFDYYDADAYTKATENFNSFKQNKERLFKILSFIKIYNREIHALEGPGYWVTWSEQLYHASNLSTEGVRRLYWQKDDKGRYRIVGMEWTPRDLGMQAAFKKGQLVAQAPAPVVTDASSEAPRAPRLDMPEQPENTESVLTPAPPVMAKEDNRSYLGRVSDGLSASIAALAKNLLSSGEPLVPRRLPRLESPAEIDWGKGQPINRSNAETPPREEPAGQNGASKKDDAAKSAPAVEPEPKTLPEARPAARPKPEKTAPVPVVAEKPSPQDDLTTLKGDMAAWLKDYTDRNNDIVKLYDQKNFNRMVKEGVPKGLTLARTLDALNRELTGAWLVVMHQNQKFALDGPTPSSTCEIMIATPAGIRQGLQTLWWKKADDGHFKIVSSQFMPKDLGMEVNYLESVSEEVTDMIESWRRAWEKAHLDEYLSYYSPDAVQQGRMGQKNIGKQKELLWSRVKPVKVKLSGLRLVVDKNGIRADMNQDYADNAGKSDKGIKTLMLRFDGKNWRIYHEDWTNLAPASQKQVKPRTSGHA